MVTLISKWTKGLSIDIRTERVGFGQCAQSRVSRINGDDCKTD